MKQLLQCQILISIVNCTTKYQEVTKCLRVGCNSFPGCEYCHKLLTQVVDYVHLTVMVIGHGIQMKTLFRIELGKHRLQPAACYKHRFETLCL